EEVVFTEKIHGKNCRVGLVKNGDGWEFMAGSHDVRRKEFALVPRRFVANDLVERGTLRGLDVAVDTVFPHDGKLWKVTEVVPPKDDGRVFLRTLRVGRDGTPEEQRSEFWEPLTDAVRRFLEWVRDEYPWPEPKVSVVLYGELFGSGVQDM